MNCTIVGQRQRGRRNGNGDAEMKPSRLMIVNEDCHVIILCCGLTLVALLGCTCSRSQKMSTTRLDSFVQRVESTPAWILLTPDEFHERAGEIDALGMSFQKFSVEYARTIVMRLSERAMKRHNPGEPLDSLSRIYVLLRFYFRVPSWEHSENAKYFGGWLGVPERDGKVSLLWPLEEHTDGSVHLENACSGYMGDACNALDEFDYFRNKYGPRKTKGD